MDNGSPVSNHTAVITPVCRNIVKCACGAEAETRLVRECKCVVPMPLDSDTYPYTGALCDHCFNYVGGIEALPLGWEFGNGTSQIFIGKGTIFCHGCILDIINAAHDALLEYAKENPAALWEE